MKTIYVILIVVVALIVLTFVARALHLKKKVSDKISFLTGQYNTLLSKSGLTDTQKVIDWYNSNKDTLTGDYEWTITIMKKMIENGTTFSEQCFGGVNWIKVNQWSKKFWA